jgi:hypothetical protein
VINSTVFPGGQAAFLDGSVAEISEVASKATATMATECQPWGDLAPRPPLDWKQLEQLAWDQGIAVCRNGSGEGQWARMERRPPELRQADTQRHEDPVARVLRQECSGSD